MLYIFFYSCEADTQYVLSEQQVKIQPNKAVGAAFSLQPAYRMRAFYTAILTAFYYG